MSGAPLAPLIPTISRLPMEPLVRVQLQEGGALEAVLQVEGHGAVENGFAGDAHIPDGSGVGRAGAGVQGVAPHAGDGDDVPIPLEAGVQGPQHVVGIENVYVLVHQNDVLQLREGGEGQKRRLPLLSLVGVDGLSALEDGHVFAAARAVGVAVDHLSRQSLVDHAQNGRLGGDASHIHVLLAGADAGLHNGVLPVSDRFHLQ